MKNIKTQIQAQRTPSMVIPPPAPPKHHTPEHTIFKQLEKKRMERRSWRQSEKRKKKKITYRRIKIKIAKFLLSEIMQGSWNELESIPTSCILWKDLCRSGITSFKCLADSPVKPAGPGMSFVKRFSWIPLYIYIYIYIHTHTHTNTHIHI